VLIEAGADVTIAAAGGVTALAMAQRRGNQAAVKLLETAVKKP
jgi:ankyrin repeat protein